MKKIIIVTKSLDSRGGIAAFFRLFKEHFSLPGFQLCFFAVGSRAKDYDRREKRALAYGLDLWRDLRHFRRLLRTDPEIEIVQVNPSLIPVALLRDALILRLARRYHKKTIVFFHGWREENIALLNRHSWLRRIFQRNFLRADEIFILAQRFAQPLLAWQVPPERLHVTTTAYDKNLQVPQAGIPVDAPARLLYLGRVSAAKGIEDLIEACRILTGNGVDYHLNIYGHAADRQWYEQFQQHVAERGLSRNIEFNGYVDGEAKYLAYANADIYVLPSWAEGCPTTVLEALGAGCFICATAVGAVPEIVNPRCGRLTEAHQPEKLAKMLAQSIAELDSIRAGREDIRQFAARNYDSPIICRKFSAVYRNLLGDS